MTQMAHELNNKVEKFPSHDRGREQPAENLNINSIKHFRVPHSFYTSKNIVLNALLNILYELMYLNFL